MNETTAPMVRMDRSRDFATVTGERTPNTEHHALHFIQNGLPFDSEGMLIHDHAFFEASKEFPSKNAKMLRDRAEKLIQKAIKNARPHVEGEPPPEGEEDEDKQDGPANLEQWARGEARVPWNEVTQAIANRFKKRVSNKRDAIDLLLEERVVAKADLSEEHRKLVEGE